MKRKILFLCVHNSARSQMAEAIINGKNLPDFEAFSAGSDPAIVVHPLAQDVLEEQGIDRNVLKTKHMDEYLGESFDFVITLCDKMKEQCPVFLGQPVYAHWSMEDPTEIEGSVEEKKKAFHDAYRLIGMRINRFLNIPVEKLDRAALEINTQAVADVTLDSDKI